MKFIKFMFMPITIPIKVLTWMVRVTSTASDGAVEASWKANSKIQSFLSNGPRLAILATALFILATCSGVVS